jgi:hypothetical protein
MDCLIDSSSNLQSSRHWYSRLRLMMRAGVLQLDDLLNTHENTAGIGVFITQTMQKFFFVGHEYEVLKLLNLDVANSEVMFKKKKQGKMEISL